MLLERVGPDVSLFPSSSLSACFRLVEADLGVAVLPRALGKAYVDAGTIREFDPGWVPGQLRFSASYLGEPKSHVTERAAKTAFDVAMTVADYAVADAPELEGFDVPLLALTADEALAMVDAARPIRRRSCSATPKFPISMTSLA